MAIYLTKRNGYKKQLFGWQAIVMGTILAIVAPIMMLVGLAIVFVGPILAIVAIIGGIVDITIMGFNFWNLFWVAAGVLFFCFYRIRINK